MISEDNGTRTDWRPWRAELAAVAKLSGPITLTNLTQMAMGTTDVVMMGWLGPKALAAGSLGVNLYFILVIFGIGLISAASPLIANAIGRDSKPEPDVARTVKQGFWLATSFALPSWCILWLSEPILLLMGQDPELARAATSYVHVLQWSILPFLAYLVLRSFVSALSRPGWSLVIGCVALVINACGNWCLMLGRCGFEPFGLAGSGLATFIATSFMFAGLALVVCIDPQFRRFHIFRRWWQSDFERFGAFARLGLPLAATIGFEVTIFNAAVFFMGLIGADALAAHAIAIQVASLSFMVPLGIGHAATIRVGVAYGARDPIAITRSGWSALLLGVTFSLVAALAMVVFPLALISIFLDVTDPKNFAIVSLAQSFLLVAALFQLVDATQGVASGMLRGLQDARAPMLFALFGYWGLGLPIGVILAFPLRIGGLGIWIGLALGLAVVAGLMLWRWHHRESLRLAPSLVISVADT